MDRLNFQLPDLRKTAIAIITLIILALLLTGCSVTTGITQKKRAKKMVDKAVRLDPSLLQNKEIRFDTVVVTPPIQATDTFRLKEFDTITNTVNDIKYRIIRRVDTFQVDIECPPDTVKIEVVKNVPQVKYIPLNWWQRNNWWIFIILIVGSALFIAKKFLNIRI